MDVKHYADEGEMATTIDDLLRATETAARDLTCTPPDIAGAATATGHLGRALAGLAGRGTRSAPTWSESDRCCHRISVACARLADIAPLTQTRLTELAAATADAVGVVTEHSTERQRWATAVAIVDVLEPLIDTVGELPISTIPHVIVNELATYARQAQHHAAQRPPTRLDNTVLDRPIPALWNPPAIAADMHTERVTLPDAVAHLLRAAGNRREPYAVADVRALSLTAEAIARAALPAELTPRDQWPRDMTAADGWRALRAQLAGFTDGMRREDRVRPSLLHAASVAYTLARTASPDELADATQRLPLLAEGIAEAISAWPHRSWVCAMTVQSGILRPVRADAHALQPAVTAAEDARRLSTMLADRTGHAHNLTLAHTWLHHHGQAHSATALDRHSDAQARAYRYAARPAPALRPGPRR